jgi:hypothetical protein
MRQLMACARLGKVRDVVVIRRCNPSLSNRSGKWLAARGWQYDPNSLQYTLVLFVVACLHPAAAQVVIPHGDFDSDFEKYLEATISFVLLCLAARQFYRNRR